MNVLLPHMVNYGEKTADVGYFWVPIKGSWSSEAAAT